MTIASVVGTRPQLIKLAAMLPALDDHVIVDTGQHWDAGMAGDFFDELGIPEPHFNLGIHGGRQGQQTALMLVGLEMVLGSLRPDTVLLYGDTNSTLAGALAAAKLGIPAAHVEAGLRSRDRAMPEELNRIATDHLATWCFAPNGEAVANLAAEGIAGIEVGDPLEDIAAAHADEVLRPALVEGMGLRPGDYAFATIHRLENRTPAAVRGWWAILAEAARRWRVVLALHPGTRAALPATWYPPEGVEVIDPVGYRTSLSLQAHAAVVLTDSGGVQRESSWFGTPCLVLRRSTEWGVGRLVGLDLGAAVAALDALAPERRVPGFSDAARRIVEAIAA